MPTVSCCGPWTLDLNSVAAEFASFRRSRGGRAVLGLWSPLVAENFPPTELTCYAFWVYRRPKVSGDDWLRNRARQLRDELAEQRMRDAAIQAETERQERIFDTGIDALWRQLQAEFRRQVGIFNDEFGEQDLYVECNPDAIWVQRGRGERRVTLQLNRADRRLIRATHPEPELTRALNVRGQNRGFTITDDGSLAFTAGTPEEIVASALKFVIA
jgi:hypothetical protein